MKTTIKEIYKSTRISTEELYRFFIDSLCLLQSMNVE